MDKDKQLTLIQELEIIMAAHHSWLNKAVQSLVCGTEGGRVVGEADTTPFARWYYGTKDDPVYSSLNGLEVLGDTYTAMFEAYLDLQKHKKRCPKSYDDFMSLALRLTTKLRHLQLEAFGVLMTTDPLTGCKSRRGMMVALRNAFDAVQTQACHGTLCIVDFDKFKAINDNHGHPAGDEVLRQGVEYLRSQLADVSEFYRYGGEEFLICLKNLPFAAAERRVEDARQGLAALSIRLADDQTIQVTASFGLVDLAMCGSVDECIANADFALIRAKQNGRNRVEAWRNRIEPRPEIT